MNRGFSQSPQKRPVRGLFRGLATLFFAIGVISGCGNKATSVAVDRSQAAIVGQKTNPSWLSGCVGCANIQKPLTVIRQLSSTSQDNNVRMSFALVVDTSIPDFNFADPKIATEYYGRATLLGRWRITQVADRNLCGAPVGEYILRPLTPSYMTAGVVSGGTYEAVGPVRIVLRLQSSTLTNPEGAVNSASNGNRVSFNAVIDTVNNAACAQPLLGN